MRRRGEGRRSMRWPGGEQDRLDRSGTAAGIAGPTGTGGLGYGRMDGEMVTIRYWAGEGGSGAVHPFLGAIDEHLPLPHRQPVLDLLDQPPARLEGLGPVRRAHRGHQRDVADL